MHRTLKQLNLIKNKVNDIVNKKQLKINPEIIVVTKTFPLSKIIPLLKNGHVHYGENKIQEAETKWSEAKNKPTPAFIPIQIGLKPPMSILKGIFINAKPAHPLG